jgi:hypothetical protein
MTLALELLLQLLLALLPDDDDSYCSLMYLATEEDVKAFTDKQYPVEYDGINGKQNPEQEVA